MAVAAVQVGAVEAQVAEQVVALAEEPAMVLVVVSTTPAVAQEQVTVLAVVLTEEPVVVLVVEMDMNLTNIGN